MLLLLAWLTPVSLCLTAGAWMYSDLFGNYTGWQWLIPPVTLWQVILLGLPLLPLALLWRTPRYRAVFQTWLLAIGFLLVMIPTGYFRATQSQLVSLYQVGATVVYATGLSLLFFWRGRLPQADNVGLWPALTCVGLLIYPWLAWGALGSPLDVVLNLLAGLGFGLIASLILSAGWLTALQEDSPGLGWNIFTGGWVVGVMLLIMASGFGFNGSQTILMMTLSGLGWLVMSLSYIAHPTTPQRNWPAIAGLIGLTTAALLLLIDTDTLLFILIAEEGEFISWGFTAAFISLIMGLSLGLMGWVVRRQLIAWQPSSLMVGVMAWLWLIGIMIYGLFGQPGFYGDRLFVIFKDQADLSVAVSMTDYDARRQYVYDTLVNQANESQADVRWSFDLLGVRYTPYYLVNAIEVQGGLFHRLWLMTRPEVDRVLASPVLRPLPEIPPSAWGQAEAPANPSWNLTTIGADRVWDELGVTGRGIVIGQSDSGVQADHWEIERQYRGRFGSHDYNWFDPWYGTFSPVDVGGHGTHTLGSIVGETVGVAPGAAWFGCRNLGRNLANPALYLDCMQFMLAPFPLTGDPFTEGDPTRSAHITNNSWGCPPEEGCDPNALLAGVQAMRAAGIFMVVSAGNEGPECSTVNDPLALYDEVFSVGAVDRAGQIANFSSLGPVTVDGSGRLKPDIVAPGVNILSAYPRNSYYVASGTSMAGPHVAGVVALMWSANPALIGDIERTQQILRDTATPLPATESASQETSTDHEACQPTAPLPNNVVGYGMVDAYAAVKMALDLAGQ